MFNDARVNNDGLLRVRVLCDVDGEWVIEIIIGSHLYGLHHKLMQCCSKCCVGVIFCVFRRRFEALFDGFAVRSSISSNKKGPMS